MKDYLLQRAKEPSTWRGFVLLLTAAGVGISPAQADLIVQVGLALAGAMGVLTADKGKDNATPTP